jgi:hypothetical protein
MAVRGTSLRSVLPLGLGPVADQIPGGIERLAVIEQAGPYGGQRQDVVAIAHVGAALLEELLETHLGEQGREMVLPILHRRPDARQLRQLALHEGAETLAGDVDVLTLANDEVHRHIERVFGIAVEAKALFEGEGQHAGPGVVGIEPDVRAEAQIARGLAVDEGRIGEQRGDDGLQRHRDAQLLDHVGFVGEIEVRLHGGRAVHHRGAERAHLLHVLGHDAVARFRHGGDFGNRPTERGDAETEKVNVERTADGATILEMRIELGGGIVDGELWRAREFELAARLERDAADGAEIAQADRVAAIEERVPAGASLDTVEQRVHAIVAGIGDRGERGFAVNVLFVLGADAPFGLRLAADGHDLKQVCPRFNQRCVFFAGHRHSSKAELPGSWPGAADNTEPCSESNGLYRQSPMVD